MKKLFILALLMFASCTPKPENKVTEVLQKEFSKEIGLADYNKSLDQLYGKDSSKFKTSLTKFLWDRVNFVITDVKVNGDKASAAVNVTIPNRKDVQGIVGFTLFMDQRVLKDMTLDELITKLSKDSKAGSISLKDIKNETFKETVELNRDGDQWRLDPTSKKKVADTISKSKG